MSVDRTLAKHPPREPLTTLAAMVRDWEWRFGPGGPLERQLGHDDPMVPMCRDSKSVREAIAIAIAGKRPNGKMFPMQSCISKAAMAAMERALITLTSAHEFTNFDELHDAIWEVRPRGVGPTTVYNLACRIGAFLGLEPAAVYLHAGPAIGWRRLTGDKSNRLRIPAEELPKELKHLSPIKVEDFLCEFRNFFYKGLL